MVNSGVPSNHGQLDSFDDLHESVRRIAHLEVAVSRVGVAFCSHLTGAGMRVQDVSSLAQVQLIAADPFRHSVKITNHGLQRIVIHVGVGDGSCMLWLAAETSIELSGPEAPRAALWAIAEPTPVANASASEDADGAS
jgi:hypothetical protein